MNAAIAALSTLRAGGDDPNGGPAQGSLLTQAASAVPDQGSLAMQAIEAIESSLTYPQAPAKVLCGTEQSSLASSLAKQPCSAWDKAVLAM